ncbi:MAG: 16S rRNA (uracil(1498)-N(3))-methyltransferase [Prevotellaceae bacterium]|jgi:16S rRNA (uracil1498-N3)-methyltransferase|nr:16S rRNA (uracil(1498)-N(3))-methyltransferase [Prevotellaceae bacterium]
MTLFYAPDISKTPFLPEEESSHCCRVLRLQQGDNVHIIDGCGGFYLAEILDSHPKHTHVKLLSADHAFEQRPYRLHLAIAPTKSNERMEWLVEKAVEIGIDCITPLLCARSERRVIKTERLEKIAVAACKQSLKACLPQIEPLTPFNRFIAQPAANRHFIAHCYTSEKPLFSVICPSCEAIVVMIGPEGDFSEEEVRLAMMQGVQSISLGNSRLRTETAGIVACHTVALINGWA